MSSSEETYELTLKPVTERRAPTFERLLERARALTAASANWEPRNTISGSRTFSLKPAQGKGPRWWARVSEHDGNGGKNGFDQLYGMFTKDRFENEKEYNKYLSSAVFLKNVKWGEVWSLHYLLPAPFSPRVSTILTATHLENTTPRVAWVFSIPFEVDSGDIPLSLFVEAGEKSIAISVERLRELEGGRVEWLCASSTSMGGFVPQRLSEHYAVKRTASLVPAVDEWLKKPPKQHTGKSKRQPTPGSVSGSTSEAVSRATRRTTSKDLQSQPPKSPE